MLPSHGTTRTSTACLPPSLVRAIRWGRCCCSPKSGPWHGDRSRGAQFLPPRGRRLLPSTPGDSQPLRKRQPLRKKPPETRAKAAVRSQAERNANPRILSHAGTSPLRFLPPPLPPPRARAELQPRPPEEVNDEPGPCPWRAVPWCCPVLPPTLFFPLLCQLEAREQGIRGFALHAAKFDMSFNRRQMVREA